MSTPHILGIIPARGGSQGILRKNLVPLLGKPLLAYTCEAAKRSKRLTRVMLSTDDEEIARVGKECGIDVPFLRPKELATDETPMLEVLRHVLRTLHDREGYSPGVIVLLQPTSPLRQSEHIDAAIELFDESDADTVVSVIPVPHQFLPSSLMKFENDRIVPYEQGTTILRRQEKPALYARNGPALLVTKSSFILEKGFYDGNVRPFLMDRESSVDIDGAEDLAYAEYLLSSRRSSS
jgi:CMP-N-acetylneuraminic acid synthetase